MGAGGNTPQNHVVEHPAGLGARHRELFKSATSMPRVPRLMIPAAISHVAAMRWRFANTPRHMRQGPYDRRYLVLLARHDWKGRIHLRSRVVHHKCAAPRSEEGQDTARHTN